MNEIQAAQITDIESYKKITGAKRFKRTKDEVDMGLTPQKALEYRIKNVLDGTDQSKKSNVPANNREIVLRIKPDTTFDWPYEFPSEIVVSEDSKWFDWLEELWKMDNRYNEDIHKLITDILDLGIGEAIAK